MAPGRCCPDAALFHSRTQKAGVFWPGNLRTHLAEASLGVALISREGLTRPNWPLFEIGALSRSSHHVVRTFLLDVSSSEALPPPLSHFQWEGLGAKQIAELVREINTLLRANGLGAPSSLIESMLDSSAVTALTTTIDNDIRAAASGKAGSGWSAYAPSSTAIVKQVWSSVRPQIVPWASMSGNQPLLQQLQQLDGQIMGLP